MLSEEISLKETCMNYIIKNELKCNNLTMDLIEDIQYAKFIELKKEIINSTVLYDYVNRINRARFLLTCDRCHKKVHSHNSRILKSFDKNGDIQEYNLCHYSCYPSDAFICIYCSDRYVEKHGYLLYDLLMCRKCKVGLLMDELLLKIKMLF